MKYSMRQANAETGSQTAEGARGWGRRDGKLLRERCKVSVWDEERLLRADSAEGGTHCERSQCQCGVHLNAVKRVNFMLYTFHNKKGFFKEYKCKLYM